MNKIKRLTYQIIIYIAYPFLKKKHNGKKIIALSSWCGEMLIDNPFYFAKEIDNDSYWDKYWIGEKNIKQNVEKEFKNIKFLDKNKLSTLFFLMKADVVCHCQMLTGDFPPFNLLYKKAIKIQFDHGLPIKKCGLDNTIDKHKPSFLKKLSLSFFGSNVKDDYYISSSNICSEVFCSSYGINISQTKPFGSPRNDYLINLSAEEVQRNKAKYCDLFSIDPNKTIILYAPTYRRHSSNNISLNNLKDENKKILHDILKRYNCVIIEKTHFAGMSGNAMVGYSEDNIINISSFETNFQELLSFSDCLISDYSGAIIDYALLDRPQITYVFDYDYYRDYDSGLYFDVDFFAPGDIAYNEEELINLIQGVLEKKNNQRNKRDEIIKHHLNYEKGNCSKQVNAFLKKELENKNS